MKRVKLDLVASYFVCALIAVTAIALNYIYLFPGADVVDNSTWHLHVERGAYSIGDTMRVKSEFEKLVDSQAIESQRFIECRNSRGLFDKYPTSTSDRPFAAKPGRYFGDNARYLTLIVPVLPKNSDCRVAIETHYRIRIIRNVTERNVSNEFRIQ